MKDISLDVSQVRGESVEIRFLPLSAVTNLNKVLWKKNAKKHDLKSILESIDRYGFIDPPKWDSSLNDGTGGLLYGNGRTTALIGALIEAQRLGQKPPRGIPTAIDTGEWCIPVKFGVDQDSEAIAIAGAIDHNNITLSGSGLDVHQIAQIWDDDYVTLVKLIADQKVMPITVNEDGLKELIENFKTPDFEASTLDEQSILDKAAEKKEINCICPKCNHEFIRQM
jgi:hypothetical protein